MGDITPDLLLKIFGDKEVIAFRPAFGRALGSLTAGLLLSQALYWQREVGINDWFYKLRDAERDEDGNMLPPSSVYRQSWEWELGGMGRYEQETARKILVREGFLLEKKKGIPAKLYFQVNLERLYKLILNKQQIADFSQLAGGKTTSKLVENQPARRGKNHCLYTETTTETTTKTTPPPVAAFSPVETEKVGVVDIEEYVKANIWLSKKAVGKGGKQVLDEISYKNGIRRRIKKSGVEVSDEEALQLFNKHLQQQAQAERAKPGQEEQLHVMKIKPGQLMDVLKNKQPPKQSINNPPPPATSFLSRPNYTQPPRGCASPPVTASFPIPHTSPAAPSPFQPSQRAEFRVPPPYLYPLKNTVRSAP